MLAGEKREEQNNQKFILKMTFSSCVVLLWYFVFLLFMAFVLCVSNDIHIFSLFVDVCCSVLLFVASSLPFSVLAIQDNWILRILHVAYWRYGARTNNILLVVSSYTEFLSNYSQGISCCDYKISSCRLSKYIDACNNTDWQSC